jgi:hypothetical protein
LGGPVTLYFDLLEGRCEKIPQGFLVHAVADDVVFAMSASLVSS